MAECARCPKCGAAISERAIEGLCPKCLLAAGLDTAPLVSGRSEPGNSLADDARRDPESAGPSTRPKVRYFGDYELLEEIARGGMGVVYKARQINLDRIVALKMILAGQLAGEKDIRRFYAEARAAASLDHPGIVPTFEIGEHEGQHYFSMAYIEGRSLADTLRAGPLPPESAARLAKAIAEAVASAHHQGVIHRDLKPANVLIDRAGNPKITDFGLAKKTSDPSGSLTATGQILGTPGYMAPEQAWGDSDQVGELSDIYSLGATLYAMLTGRPPFLADTPLGTLQLARHGHLVKPSLLNPQVPRDLEAIVLKALARHPQDRFQSAGELVDDLQRYLSGQPIRARPLSVWKWAARSNLPAGIPVPPTVCMCGAATLMLGLASPAVSLSIAGDKSILASAPRFVAPILFTAAAAFFLSGGRRYRGLIATGVVSAIVSLLTYRHVAALLDQSNRRFDNLSSWLRRFHDQAASLSWGWWLLGIGTTLLLVGAGLGLVRQADRPATPRPVNFLQLAAALFVLLIGIGIVAPLTCAGRRALPPEVPAFVNSATVQSAGGAHSSRSLFEMSPGAARLVLVLCAASLVAIGAGRLGYLPVPALITPLLVVTPVWKVTTTIDRYVHHVHWIGASCLLGGCAGLLAVFAAHKLMRDDDPCSDPSASDSQRRLQVMVPTYFLLATIVWFGLFVTCLSILEDTLAGVLPVGLLAAGIALAVEGRVLFRRTRQAAPKAPRIPPEREERRITKPFLSILRQLAGAAELWMLAIPAGLASLLPSVFAGVGLVAVWIMGCLLCALGFALSRALHAPMARTGAWALIALTTIYSFAVLQQAEQLFRDPGAIAKTFGLLPASVAAVLLWLVLTSGALLTARDKGWFSTLTRRWS